MTYCTFLEGDQAEAYKRRKAADKEKQNKEYDKYNYRRNSGITGKQWKNFDGDIPENKKDAYKNSGYRKSLRKAMRSDDDNEFDRVEGNLTGNKNDGKVRKDFYNNRNGYSAADINAAYDASRRHARRHPQSESAGIFGNIDII